MHFGPESPSVMICILQMYCLSVRWNQCKTLRQCKGTRRARRPHNQATENLFKPVSNSGKQETPQVSLLLMVGCTASLPRCAARIMRGLTHLSSFCEQLL